LGGAMNFASNLVNFDVGSSSDEEVEVTTRRRLRYSDCEIADDAFSGLPEEENDDDDVEADPFGGFSAPPAPGAAAGAPPPPAPQQKKPKRKGKKSVRVRKLNTNVVELALGTTLSAESSDSVMTGDPVFCKDCGAVFSSVSKLTPKEAEDGAEDDGTVTGAWECEFCSCSNEVTLDKEEIPKGTNNDYLVDDSLRASNSSTDEQYAAGTGLTVFVVDISGSMCITSEVQGGKKLQGFERLQRQQRELNPENEDQFLPGQARDVSYISRLQCVQAAVDHQIELMHKKDPNGHVAVVTFNNEVCLIGDGLQAPVTLAGDKLWDYDQVLAAGKDFPLGATIKEGAETLRSKVFSLNENGATALGPALLSAVGMASAVPGSTVVVCTDGMANTGVGTLEVAEAQLEEVEGFYNKVGGLASESGVVVNIVSIEGSDCRMEYLSAVADATGGKVTMVNPLKLVTEFASLLADPVVASQVSITFVLHKGLYCTAGDSSEEKKETSERPQLVRKRIGNVTADTVELFEYGVRAEARNDSSLTTLPFQVQVRFRRQSDGLELIRVITETKDVTRDRTVAERAADLQVLGVHAAKQSATFAMAGEYSQARGYAFRAKEYLKKVTASSADNSAAEAGYVAYKRNLVSMEDTLQKAQRAEEVDGLCLSDSDEDDDDWGDVDEETASLRRKEAVERKDVAKKLKLQSRKKKRSDKAATSIFKFKHANAKTFVPSD